MNNKIIAISLLLSFLMVLVHVVIPHHHHEGVMVEYSTTCERELEGDAHGDTCATEASSQSQTHDHAHSSHACVAHGWQEHLHDYTHNHPVTDCHALNIARRSSDTELSRLNRILLPLFVSTFLDIPLPDSDNNTKTFYTEYYPLLCSLFVPEANALRGPPSLA